jgi:hypothetical protein
MCDDPQILEAETEHNELDGLPSECDLGVVCCVTRRDFTAVSAVHVRAPAMALMADPTGDPGVILFVAVDRIAVP